MAGRGSQPLQQLKKEGSSLGMQRRLGCTHSDHHESAWKVYHVTHKTAQPSGEVMHDLVPQALWDLPQTSSSPPSQPCLPLAPTVPLTASQAQQAISHLSALAPVASSARDAFTWKRELLFSSISQLLSARQYCG